MAARNIRSAWALSVRTVRTVLNEFSAATAAQVVETALDVHNDHKTGGLSEAEWFLLWNLYRRAKREGAKFD